MPKVIQTSLNKVGFAFLEDVAIYALLSGYDGSQSKAEDLQEIDTSRDPIQIPYNLKEPIIIKTENGKFTIKPAARYKASAMIARKKFYSDGWQSKIAPVDLVLVWGRLAEPEYNKYVTYTQRDRWYFLTIGQEVPLIPLMFMPIHQTTTSSLPIVISIRQ